MCYITSPVPIVLGDVLKITYILNGDKQNHNDFSAQLYFIFYFSIKTFQ